MPILYWKGSVVSIRVNCQVQQCEITHLRNVRSAISVNSLGFDSPVFLNYHTMLASSCGRKPLRLSSATMWSGIFLKRFGCDSSAFANAHTVLARFCGVNSLRWPRITTAWSATFFSEMAWIWFLSLCKCPYCVKHYLWIKFSQIAMCNNMVCNRLENHWILTQQPLQMLMKCWRVLWLEFSQFTSATIWSPTFSRRVWCSMTITCWIALAVET